VSTLLDYPTQVSYTCKSALVSEAQQVIRYKLFWPEAQLDLGFRVLSVSILV